MTPIYLWPIVSKTAEDTDSVTIKLPQDISSVPNLLYSSCCYRNKERCDVLGKSCPWVGLTHGLSWVGSGSRFLF